MTNYSFIRKTRPDGNCFYRAFIFSYFESLFNDENEQKRFSEVCEVTRRGIAEVLGFPDFTIDEFYDYVSNVFLKFIYQVLIYLTASLKTSLPGFSKGESLQLPSC